MPARGHRAPAALQAEASPLVGAWADHGATVASDDSFIDKSLHINGQVDHLFTGEGEGMTFDSTDKTCTGGCHSRGEEWLIDMPDAPTPDIDPCSGDMPPDDPPPDGPPLDGPPPDDPPGVVED